MDKGLTAEGFTLQVDPRIYVCALPGPWLLRHATPSWRIDDPEKGFQRVVREKRAREIAVAVLEQSRTFPNAIVLATDRLQFGDADGCLVVPDDAKFLVVDGQHRLWAQHFSAFEAQYACVVHMGLTEVEMAHLFLEINDNQKRVPSSLRWDLVRLVRPEDDPTAIAAAEMVYVLATEEGGPLFQRVDLTGEQSEIQLKQGSLAPGIQRLLRTKSPLQGLSFDQQYQVVLDYLIAIQDVDGDDWGTTESRFYKARVLRALLRLLPELLENLEERPTEVTWGSFTPYLTRIDKAGLDPGAIRAAQGNAGVAAIYRQIREQVLGS